MTSVITGNLSTHRSRVHEASVKASLANLSLDQAIVMYQRRGCTVLLTCGFCFSLRYFRTDCRSAIVTGKILLSHQHGSCFWNLIKTINWIKLEYSVSPSRMGESINFAFWYLEPSIFWPLCTLWCPLPLPLLPNPVLPRYVNVHPSSSNILLPWVSEQKIKRFRVDAHAMITYLELMSPQVVSENSLCTSQDPM